MFPTLGEIDRGLWKLFFSRKSYKIVMFVLVDKCVQKFKLV